MADRPNYPIDENPTYSDQIPELMDTDPASATNTFNPLIIKILNNIKATHILAQKSAENGGYVTQDTPPENTNLWWFDSSTNTLKYYDDESKIWQPIPDGTSWHKVDGSVSIGDPAPEGAKPGDYVLDSQGNTYVVNEHNQLDLATSGDSIFNNLQSQIDEIIKSSVIGIKLGDSTIQTKDGTIEIPAATNDTNGYMTTDQAKQLADAVPQSRTINGHALSADVTIAPSDLTQDATHRFVSDAEKAAWNAKTQVKSFSVTAPATGWGDAAPYSQTITVDGLTDGDAHLYLSPATAGQPTEDEETAFACVTGGTTASNSLTLYCRDDKPANDINVRLEVIS